MRHHFALFLAGPVIAAGVAAAAAAAPATAAVLRASGAVVQASQPSYTFDSRDESGFQVGGLNTDVRWYRFVTTTTTLPTDAQCAVIAAASPRGNRAAVTLGQFEEAVKGVPASSGPDSAVGVSFVPTSAGCGRISPSFASNLGSAPQFPAGAITLNPGDEVRLDLYYNQADQSTTATVFDLTAGTQAQEVLHAPAVYTSASVTAGFGATFTRPSNQFRDFEFSNSTATTYAGRRGAFGAWLNESIWLVGPGPHPDAVILASPSALWGGGADFGVWVRSENY